MDVAEILKWLTPTLVTILLAVISYIVSSHRGLAKSTSEEHRRLHDKIERVKDECAKKDDVEHHLQRVESAMSEFRREANAKFDRLTELLTTDFKR